MTNIVIPDLTGADLADEEAFNSRFGIIATKMNTSIDADNLNTNSVTRSKIAQASVTQDKMVNSETWTTVTYTNGWVDYNAGPEFGPIQYYKDARGYVHFRGLMRQPSNGTGSPFTMPVGYRPDVTMLHTINVNGTHGRLDIQATGAVIWSLSNAASSTYVSLANVSYRAVQ